MVPTPLKVIAALLICVSSAAFADDLPPCKSGGPGQLEICQKDSGAFIDRCARRVSEAKGFDSSQSGKAGVSAEKSGDSVKPGAESLGNVASLVSAQYEEAGTYCEKCLSECQTSCSKVTGPDQTPAQQAAKNCQKKIKPNVDTAKAAAKDGEVAKKESEKTEGSSGQAPQMPQLPQAEPAAEETAEAPTGNQNPYSPASVAPLDEMPFASGSLSDPAKEGSAGLNSLVDAETVKDSETPALPGLAPQSITSPIANGGGSGGGGGASVGGSAGSAIAALEKTLPKLPPQSPYAAGLGGNASAGSGGSGGSGGSSSSTETESEDEGFAKDRMRISGETRKPTSEELQAQLVAPGVMGRHGPSVFSIGSEVIRVRCSKGQHNNCGPRK